MTLVNETLFRYKNTNLRLILPLIKLDDKMFNYSSEYSVPIMKYSNGITLKCEKINIINGTINIFNPNVSQ